MGMSMDAQQERERLHYLEQERRRMEQRHYEGMAKVVRWRRLVERIEALAFPLNPLDALVEHFGVQAIAEITGRKKRMVDGQYVSRLHGTSFQLGLPHVVAKSLLRGEKHGVQCQHRKDSPR